MEILKNNNLKRYVTIRTICVINISGPINSLFLQPPALYQYSTAI